MSCQYAAEHLRNALQAYEKDDPGKAIREIAEALQLTFESGEISELVAEMYDDIPHQLQTLVDTLESAG